VTHEASSTGDPPDYYLILLADLLHLRTSPRLSSDKLSIRRSVRLRPPSRLLDRTFLPSIQRFLPRFTQCPLFFLSQAVSRGHPLGEVSLLCALHCSRPKCTELLFSLLHLRRTDHPQLDHWAVGVRSLHSVPPFFCWTSDWQLSS